MKKRTSIAIHPGWRGYSTADEAEKLTVTIARRLINRLTAGSEAVGDDYLDPDVTE